MCKIMKRLFMAIRNFVLKLVQKGSGKRTHVTIDQDAGVNVEPHVPTVEYTFEKTEESNNSVNIRSYKKVDSGEGIPVDWSIGEIEGSGASLVIITKREGGISIIDRADAEPSTMPRKWSVQLTQQESGKTLTIMGEIPGIRVEYTFEKFNVSDNSVNIHSLKKIGDRDPQNLDWKLGTVEGSGAENIEITKRDGGVDINEKIGAYSTEPKEWYVILTQDESGKTLRLEGKIGGVDWYQFNATEETGDLKGYTYLYSVDSKKRDADVPYNVIVGCSGASLVETKIFKEGLNSYLGVNVQDNVSSDPKIFKLTLTQEGSGKELKFFKSIPSLRISKGTFIVEELEENTYFIISRGLDGKIINANVDVSGAGRDLITLDFDKKMIGLFRVFFKENNSGKDLPYVITITQEGSGKKREINGVVKKSVTDPDPGTMVMPEIWQEVVGVSPSYTLRLRWSNYDKMKANGDEQLNVNLDISIPVDPNTTGGKLIMNTTNRKVVLIKDNILEIPINSPYGKPETFPFPIYKFQG